MTPLPGQGQSALNLVASDLFLGLGAVMLVVVAAVSFGLQDMVARIAGPVASTTETRQAVLALSRQTDRPLLLADAQGLHRTRGGTGADIGLDQVWTSPDVPEWLAEDPLLIIAADGQDAGFLVFSRAAQDGLGAVTTLRLPRGCRDLALTPGGIACAP